MNEKRMGDGLREGVCVVTLKVKTREDRTNLDDSG